MEVNDILEAREARRELVSRLCKDSAVITVKANIPGADKNIPHALLCTAYFANVAKNRGAYSLFADNSADGRCFIGRVRSAETAKTELSKIEEEHPIGRLIDIDVTEKASDRSMSRGKLRKCFLCGEAAFVCARRGGHKKESLISYFKERVEDCFLALACETLREAMFAELDLTDKFGLVSPTSSGSHTDLDYGIMAKAIGAIAPTLAECFVKGLVAERPEGLLTSLRPIGIRCEEKMLSVTGGANAYKGFIFVGGALLAASGYVLGHGLPFDSCYVTAAKICADMDAGMPSDTFGHFASLSGFGGIRAEAKAGFPTVNYACTRLLGGCESLRLLTEIVGKAEDSVLLKRAGREKYDSYQKLISSVNTEDREELKRVNDLCESEGISIGGSADILIAAHLMQKIKNLFMWGDE